MKKIVVVAAWVAGCVFASAGMAAQYRMEQTYTAMMPVFMVGHEGDPARIEGFEVQSGVSSAGQIVGSAVTRVELLAPPMNMAIPIAWMKTKVLYMFRELGTIEVHGIGISYGSSDAVATGEVVFAGAGSVRNGTGALAGLEGVFSNRGTINVDSGAGTETVVFDLP